MNKEEYKKVYLLDWITEETRLIQYGETNSINRFGVGVGDIDNLSDEELIEHSKNDWRILLFVENPSEEIQALIELYLL